MGDEGLPYKKTKYKSLDQEVTDEYLMQDVNVKIAFEKKLTEEQLQLYKKNKNLPRSKLANLLKIDKLTLNFTLERMRGTL
jgi:hypothetical protein